MNSDLLIDIRKEQVTTLLLPEEIETLRLVDLEGLEQEEAAIALGISRRTLWKDLHEARKKVTDALVNGKLIEFSGCPRKGEAICPHRIESYCKKQTHELCPRKFLNPEGEWKN